MARRYSLAGPKLGAVATPAAAQLPGAITVADAGDRLVADFVGLRDRRLAQRRRTEGGTTFGRFLAEGDLVTERALRAGHRLVALLVDAGRTEPLTTGADQAIAAGASLLAAGPDVVEAITGSRAHRGSMGLFERPEPLTVAAAVGNARTVAVLEGVVNPVNLGLIARSAVAMGVEALLLDPTCADPWYRRASRVSMGEVFAVPHAWLDALPGGLDPLSAAGFTLLALTPSEDAVDIGAVALGPDDRVALLLGAEGPGLSARVLARADACVRIPLSAAVDSLNVGAAAAVAAYAVGRNRRERP